MRYARNKKVFWKWGFDMFHTLTQIRMRCHVFCTIRSVKMDVFNILQFYWLCFIVDINFSPRNFECTKNRINYLILVLYWVKIVNSLIIWTLIQQDSRTKVIFQLLEWKGTTENILMTLSNLKSFDFPLKSIKV